MRPDVHAGRVPPDEGRLAVLVCSVNEVQRAIGDLLVHCFHALDCQWAGVFARLLAPGSEAWISRRGIVRVRGFALQNAARTEPRFESRILWVVGVLRLLLRVQVVEIDEEYVEAVHCGHKL